MTKVKFRIPAEVQKTARMLTKEGYQCWLVGGAVRDLALDGRTPDDWDLATNCKPDYMLTIFPKAVSTGARFGTITALVQDEYGENKEVQVTTFRSEEQYIDGRWPSKIEFVEEIDKDLGRRDFRFNAMAIDLHNQVFQDDFDKEREWDIYDPFGGLVDLGLKTVRAVGTPLERFSEDGLRAYKACRMASQFGFEIETETFNAIGQALPVAKMVSMERVRDELMKMLKRSPQPSYGIELMRATGLLELFMPELLEGRDVEQKIGHADDVYNHSLRTCDVAPDRIKMAALLHDVAKPRCDTKDGHFYGHDTMGARMAYEIMKRLRFPKNEIKRVMLLIANHMFFYPYVHDGLSEEERKNVLDHQWSDAAIRRFIARVGEHNLEDLFALRIADAEGNPKTSFQPEEIQALEQRIADVRVKDMALSVDDLDITGHDLIELGIPKGPKVGEVMKELLERVFDDPIINSKEKLEEIVRREFLV